MSLPEAEIPALVINLDRRIDRWLRMQKVLDTHWPQYRRFSAVDAITLAADERVRRLFAGNDFGDRRSFIACALSHLKVWEELSADARSSAYLILEDDVEFHHRFGQMLPLLLGHIRNRSWDVIMLGLQILRGQRNPADFDRSNSQVGLVRLTSDSLMESVIGGMFGYLLSRKGAQILLNSAQNAGIKHGIDYWLLHHFDALEMYFVMPHLVYSEYADDSPEGRDVDTDIQRDFTRLGL
jgi:GR25 family glycosyltransferase involved in LPS biosynthesis